MRVGCGSATIGMFAKQWGDKVDEVVVVDDHITGVLSEHQAGKLLGMRDTGIKMKGRRSTPGRYFHVAEPGTGWGGTNISDPLDIVAGFNPKVAWSGMTMLMVSTTGEQYAFYRLDENLRPSRGGASRKPARIGRAHQRELRAGALLGALHGGRRRLAARRRHGESGAAHALGASGADDRDRWRRAGHRLAGRRHHLHGRRHAAAGELLRLRADARHRRADRIHLAPRRLRRARRPRRRGAAARRGRRAARRAAEHHLRERRGRAPARGRGARHESAAAAATSCRRTSASARRTDRPHHRSLRRGQRRRSGLRRGVAPLRDDPRRALRGAASAEGAAKRRQPERRRVRSRDGWRRRSRRSVRGASSPRWRRSPARWPKRSSRP